MPAEVFNRAKPVLMAFGDRTVFVGHEIGHASAFDVAILTFGVSAMLGFLQGQVVWESENLPAGGFLETIKGLMPTLESIFTDMSRRVSLNITAATKLRWKRILWSPSSL